MFFIYSVKVAVCLALFYLFHKLLMSRDTFHTFNRFAILSMMLLSLVLPLVHLSLDSEAGINRGTVALEGLVAQTVVADGGNGVGEGLSLTQVLLAAYVLGVVLFVGKALLSVGSLLRLIRRARCVEVRNGIRIYTMQGDISPFSWFRYIIMSEKDWQENRREIVLHEMAHIRRCHSMDVAVCNMMIVFQWYNPAAWLLKRELQTVHEYEADEAVLSAGVDATHYQMLLIRKAVGERLFSMANNLNHNSLKKRITMMKIKRTNPMQKAKIAFVLPLAAMTVAAFASQKVENLSEKVEQESEAFSSVSDNPVVRAVGETARVAAVKVQEDKALEEASSMAMAKDTAEAKTGKKMPCTDNPEMFPQFPGGHIALFEYLSKNIKFPKSKENEDVKVRVVTTFTVEKDGSITHAKIVRSQGEAFDNEALRVINGMPKWIPGMQNGKAVSVKYLLPITFSTTDSDKKIKSVRTIDMNDNGGKQPEGKVVSRKAEMFSSEDFVLVVNGKVVEALNGIKPSDIEKVDVKKDAETMKKYNVEDKLGVMFISTK
ncbi:M56 family metallopeptidase [uncultured Prevotella sp.]|uniref:M56 family metallopeptidase n=1 Tax=uncultured Prevotella sp. TaxID=159272 RepID=UPI002604B955|nr:M56 family metallopeptidase [uncultured Prevotella sp.]